MHFRWVFIAVFIGTALVIAAFLLHRERPAGQTAEPTPGLVKATGKCAQCHRRETGAIVQQFEHSAHAEAGVNCLDCHRPAENQESQEHRGFT